jgi:hypothetical protein
MVTDGTRARLLSHGGPGPTYRPEQEKFDEFPPPHGFPPRWWRMVAFRTFEGSLVTPTGHCSDGSCVTSNAGPHGDA